MLANLQAKVQGPLLCGSTGVVPAGVVSTRNNTPSHSSHEHRTQPARHTGRRMGADWGLRRPRHPSTHAGHEARGCVPGAWPGDLRARRRPHPPRRADRARGISRRDGPACLLPVRTYVAVSVHAPACLHCCHSLTQTMTHSLTHSLTHSPTPPAHSCMHALKHLRHPFRAAWEDNSPDQILPVFTLPLGEPLADAVLRGGVWRRAFASGTNVTFDTTTNRGAIQWASRRGNNDNSHVDV